MVGFIDLPVVVLVAPYCRAVAALLPTRRSRPERLRPALAALSAPTPRR